MALFRMDPRVSFRSRHLRVESGVRVGWVTRRRPEVAAVDLASEPAASTAPAELDDLGAMLDRYSDHETAETRSILAGHARRRLG